MWPHTPCGCTQFMGILNHAAAAGHRCGDDKGQGGSGLGEAIGEDELHFFVQANAPGRDAAISEALDRQRKRALVFLPGEHIGIGAEWAGLQQFMPRAFSNAGHTTNGFPLAGIASAHNLSPPFRLMLAK